MSKDPFGWPNQLGAPAAAPNTTFQASFSPLNTGLQQPAPGPSGGWVSFDDDSSCGGFAATSTTPTTAPTASALTGATHWAPRFDNAPELAWPTQPAPALTHAFPTSTARPVFVEPLRRPPVHVPTSVPAATATSPTFAVSPSAPGSANAFLPSSFPAAQPTSPSLPPQHGASVAASGSSGIARAPTSGLSVEPAVGIAIHRLPRPPTSSSRPPAVASSSNPFGSQATTVPAASGISNPFAAGTHPQPGPSAAARSLDPFADLSLRPALPRPPPMATTKGAGAGTGSAVVAVAGPAATLGPSLASAPLAATAPARDPQTAAVTSSVFPTFAALHQQAAAAAAPRGLPEASPAATTAPPPHLPASTTAASPVVPVTASGTWWERDNGVIKTTSFDVFYSPLKTAQLGQQRHAGNAATAAATMQPPPPPYAAALDMPSPTAALRYEGLLATSPQLSSPPPAYTEALGMPEAPPVSPRPPPSYEEAAALPAARAGAAGPDLLRADTVPSWATFDDGFGVPSLGGCHSLDSGKPSDDVAALSPTSTTAPPPPPKSLHAPLPEQICVEVRLPPLKPKGAAWPKKLAAGMGLAFAAPGGDGAAALQWWLKPRQGHVVGPGMGPDFSLPAGAAPPRVAEDRDSAPAAAVQLTQPVAELSAACCMLLNDVSGGLWTGHKDGKVVRWSVGPSRAAAYEHHWRAHARGRITSMVLSPWGELWTASSAGTVRVWQYLGGSPGLRPPLRLFECRRSRLTLGAVARAAAQRAHSKARLLAVGPSGRVVWSAGRSVVVLWGAYDGEFLGTLTPGLAQEGRPGAAGSGAYAGDTGAMTKEGNMMHLEINPQAGLDSSVINRPFVQRTVIDVSEEPECGDPEIGLQVIKGIAGAAKLAYRLGKKIRQNFVDVPTGGDAGGPNEQGGGAGGRGKMVALLPGLDQSMYVAYKGGVLEKYTEWGRLLWSRDYGRTAQLYSIELVGSMLWLGCGDGFIRTAAASSGEVLRSWKAHDFPVVILAHDAGSTGRGSGLVYSLSESGSVRAWPAVHPAEQHRLAWRDGLLSSLHTHELAVLAATWNVNETRPAPQSLRRWLEPAAGTAIVSIALQEVEVGTSSVARDAAITFLSKGMLERGNQNAQWWAAELAGALAHTGHSWVRVALRQMSGLVVVVFCRAELQQHVGEVATANVACGVMGVGGNKGAVAVSMSVFRRRIMFVSSHFAAHQERVDERNENYNKIVRLLHFDNTSKAAQRQSLQTADACVREGAAAMDGAFDVDTEPVQSGVSLLEAEDDGHGPGMADAAMLVWAGDFNYRIKGTYREVCDLACTGQFWQLSQSDQCRIEMDKGNIFRGLREALPPDLSHPVFVPTYKYDKGEAHKVLTAAEPGGVTRLELPFDSSEKQRVPAWTDRVFFRGSRPGSLDVTDEEVTVNVEKPEHYNCVLEVNDSDHKPVYALLKVHLPAYNQEQKRRHSLAAATAVHHAALAGDGSSRQLVEASPSVLGISPHASRQNSTIALTNKSRGAFMVQVMAERRADGNAGGHVLCPLPTWLEVSPTTFTLAPEDVSNGGGGDSAQSRAQVHLCALAADAYRGVEPVQLRFVLHPMWGSGTIGGAVGPSVTVTVKN